MSFSALKKQSNLNSLLDEFNKQSSPETKSFDDDRFWKPELDKSGNGFAVIRFMPAPDGEEIPWVRMFSHSFQGPGGWYIENSLTTINKPDPVGDTNRRLWNSGSEADKEVARKQKRKLSYYSNIYVVSDPKHPENEGKVFLYKYGKKIFDKLMEAMQPQFEDETPVNPFDFWEGANFKMKIRKVEGYSNYDKSEFEAPSALLDDDDRLEEIWNSQTSLKELVSPDKFKTFDELKTKLDRVLGLGATSTPTPNTEEVPFDGGQPYTPPPKPAAEETTSDDDDLGYFQKLAEEA
mgnify:CR=1 FL=1